MKKAAETNLNNDDLIKLALKMGALEAKLIDAKSIVVRDWVRLKCQFGCGGYARVLTCPPFTPTADQTRQIISGYSKAIFLRLPDQSIASHNLMAKLERRIFLSGYYAAFGLHAGPCERCKECNLKRCVHPRLARPTMEACGIDVYATARKNGFSIEVRKTYREKPTYYGLVLVE